jgi:aminoglycoside phosphotransferase (APT) family kinase protein
MAHSHELDIEQPEALLQYLRQRGVLGTLEEPTIRVLGGGVSSRVVLLKRANGEAWVLKQSLPKLRVAVDWFSDPQRVHREAIALRWLPDLGLRVPAFRFEDFDHHLVAMDAVPEPHENWKTMLLDGRLDMRHVEAWAHTLADLHTRSHARRAEIEVDFADRSFFESLRIEPYYLYTAQQVVAASNFLAQVVASTRSNRICLVHGDYSPKNVLVHDQQLVLLDHEVVHFGDPAFDIGFSMTHLLSKAHHMPVHRARFREAALGYWSVYRRDVQDEDWSADVEPRAIRSTLACLLARVAGRSQLEYLELPERQNQRQVVLKLIAETPADVPDLICKFVASL